MDDGVANRPKIPGNVAYVFFPEIGGSFTPRSTSYLDPLGEVSGEKRTAAAAAAAAASAAVSAVVDGGAGGGCCCSCCWQ